MLVIGGGDGGVVREVLKHKSVTNVVLCEIDQVNFLLLYTIHDISGRHLEMAKANVYCLEIYCLTFTLTLTQLQPCCKMLIQ